MKQIFLILPIVLAMNIPVAKALGPPPIEESRCGQDSLDLNQAIGRNKWVMKCFPEARRTWKLNDKGYVNFKIGNNLIETGYFRLEKLVNDEYVVVQAPTNADTSCVQAVQEEWIITGACRASCLTPDQWVELKSGSLEIGKIAAPPRSSQANKSGKVHMLATDEIVTLHENSTLDNIIRTTNKIKAVVTDYKDVKQDVLLIETVSGQSIKTTLNHPLLNEEGKMKKAEDLRVGNYLVKADGTPDQILAITKSEYNGRVYNIDVDVEDSTEDSDMDKPAAVKTRNIMIAQGFLSGTVYYQDRGFRLVDRQISILNIPDDLIN